MGAENNNIDMEEGTLEVGMGMFISFSSSSCLLEAYLTCSTHGMQMW